MKTTIELSDHLLKRAKRLARQRNTTLRELTEEGLRWVLENEDRKEVKELKPVTFGGKGLSAEFRAASWKEIRAAAYGDQ